jgi:dipeptidyl aminopeptidase/acylaminoacyl peptidase
MPDSDEILFSAKGRLWRLAVAGPKPSGTPVQLPLVGEDALMPVVSRSSPGRPTRLAYARSFRDANIWRVESSASGPHLSSPPVVAISSTRMDINPDWSPDMRRVAFASNRSGGMEIWLAEPDGGGAVQLTSMAGQTTSPRWSPDGQLIAFQCNREGQFEIYVIPAGGGRPRNLTSHPANDHFPTFSRDGRWVYFASTRTGGFRVWKVPSSGGEAVPVTNDAGFHALEGRDGRDLYYTQEPYRPTTLRRMPARGGQAVDVLRGVIASAFTVADDGIYYLDRPASETRLQRYDFVAKRSTTVASRLGDVTPGLTASPDGRSILFSRVDVAIQDLMLVEDFQ